MFFYYNIDRLRLLTFCSNSISVCRWARLRLSWCWCCELLACDVGLAGQLESGDMGSSLMADSSISMSEQMSGDMLPSRIDDTDELQSLSYRCWGSWKCSREATTTWPELEPCPCDCCACRLCSPDRVNSATETEAFRAGLLLSRLRLLAVACVGGTWRVRHLGSMVARPLVAVFSEMAG